MAKATKDKKRKKTRNAGTVELTCQTKNEDPTKEGRHVGLDFYDLLIEALFDRDGP